MKKFGFLAVALAGTAIAGGAFGADLRFGVKQETPSIDPHFSTNVIAIDTASHVFDHLLENDDQMRLKPNLAESWRRLDDTTWEFKLRRDVKWHDGSPFTADDVVFTVERASKVKASSSFVQYVADKKVTKIDDYTVQVKTDKPNPLTDVQMASFGIVSKKHASAPDDQAAFNTGKATIGTGPYKFVEWVQGDRIVFQKNSDYWGEKARWDRVIFKPVASDPTRVAGLLSGDFDAIDKFPTTDVGRYSKDPRVVISSGTGNRPFYLWIDSRRDFTPFIKDNAGNPIRNPLRDWRVRKALSKAINRQAIVERVFEGYANPTMQLLPDKMYGWNETLTIEPYDPEGAKKLLAEAGYPQGFQTTLHSTSGRYINDLKVVEAVAQMWTQIGVKTAVETMPAQVFFSRAAAPGFSDFSLAIRTYSVATGEPSVQLKAIVHTNNWPGTVYCCSWSGYSNPRTDAIIEQAEVTMDDAAREKLWKEAIGIAVNDVGMAGIYFEQYIWGTKPGLAYQTRLDGYNLARNVVPK
ncbi:MAG: ABC transporter substrate-binding protein [Alphaproteobacteria bacterium]|nr:ABC transporter substrate-binding protein [Alphaproteobacteria bacterium]